MKKLICSFSMFDLSQKVRLIDTDENVDEIISVTSMETMPSDLSELSHIYNCNNIHLIGLESVANVLAQEICETSIKNYSNNNINIEVN